MNNDCFQQATEIYTKIIAENPNYEHKMCFYHLDLTAVLRNLAILARQ